MEVGSIKEALAMRAMRHERVTSYVQTTTIVQAIIYGAQGIMSALSEGGETPKADKLNDNLSNLLNLLLPDQENKKDGAAKKAMKQMEEEIKKGPFKVEGMSYNKPKRVR